MSPLHVVCDGHPRFLGEVAHIQSLSPFGPRFGPVGGRDVVENLIVLCPSCHRLIDSDVASYSVERLVPWQRVQSAALVGGGHE
ncbi:HNH endonuclease [Amycolatopsis azurea]